MNKYLNDAVNEFSQIKEIRALHYLKEIDRGL